MLENNWDKVVLYLLTNETNELIRCDDKEARLFFCAIFYSLTLLKHCIN